MLWPVGFTLYLGLRFLSADRLRLPLFFLLCTFPLLILFSTPYYAIFFTALVPFFLLFAVDRLRLRWGEGKVLAYIVSLFVVSSFSSSPSTFTAPR